MTVDIARGFAFNFWNYPKFLFITNFFHHCQCWYIVVWNLVFEDIQNSMWLSVTQLISLKPVPNMTCKGNLCAPYLFSYVIVGGSWLCRRIVMFEDHIVYSCPPLFKWNYFTTTLGMWIWKICVSSLYLVTGHQLHCIEEFVFHCSWII